MRLIVWTRQLFVLITPIELASFAIEDTTDSRLDYVHNVVFLKKFSRSYVYAQGAFAGVLAYRGVRSSQRHKCCAANSCPDHQPSWSPFEELRPVFCEGSDYG